MKILLSILTLIFGFSAHALVGDYYSVPGKIGRVSLASGLIEVIGAQVTFVNGDGVSKLVKAGVDLTSDGSPEGDFMQTVAGMIIQGVRTDKFMIGIISHPDFVTVTDQCIGKDFEYADPDNQFGTGKMCFKVHPRDFVIK
jgi:hypothetical protein